MGSLRFTPSQAFWEDVVEAARPGLAEVADAVQDEAERLSKEHNTPGNFRRSGGTRPKGRTFERVYFLNANPKAGAVKKPRQRLLAMAGAAVTGGPMPPGPAPQKQGRFTEKETAVLMGLRAQGIPWEQIARVLNRDENSVRDRWLYLYRKSKKETGQ